MTATIRQLTEADAESYRTLRLAALEAHPADFGADLATEQARPPAYFTARLADNHVMGAWVDGRLAGIMGLQFHSHAKARHRAYLWGVYVAPGARGRTVAPALLDATLAVAFARVEQVELDVRAGNWAAERLYASRGFVRYGLQPRSLLVDGIYYDEAMMVCAKPSG